MKAIERISNEIVHRIGILSRVYEKEVQKNGGLENDMAIYYKGKRVALKELLSTLDTMELHLPDFEEEYARYMKSKGGGNVTVNVKQMARHFFEL